MLSVFLVDMVISGIFMQLTDSWHLAWRIIPSSALMLLGANFVLAYWQFAPIARFLDGKAEFAAIERRMTQLQLQSARNVGILALVLMTFRLSLPFFLEDGYDQSMPTIVDAISTVVVEVAFFFTLIYFLIGDYLSGLGQFIFHRFGHNLSL